MLLSLAIRDVVLIEALDLDFDRGLTAITGETGAGKSILLDALGLALGRRAAAGLVRSGAAQASVVAQFDPPAAALAVLAEGGVEVEPGEPLIVRRQLKADGGSRAWVNDQPVSGALLRTLGERLVEIHGQHDDRGLLAPGGHRALLDAFGRIDVQPVRAAWAYLRDADAVADAAETALAAAARDREFLDHAVAELDALAPAPGEEALLADRRRAAQLADKHRGELEELGALLGGADGAGTNLRQAARILDRMARERPALEPALGALDRALNDLAVSEDAVLAELRALPHDGAGAEADEERLFGLRAAARKHRVAVDDLADLHAEFRLRLETVAGGEERLAAARAAVAQARAGYDLAAARVTAEREAAAMRLDAAVAAELAPLKLDAARFRTALGAGPAGELGQDRVEFEVSTNPGAPFGPLLRIASGGELSRFILALKVALAEEGSAGTMIFDEIDRGVGGAVASAIGERLARLADGTQLLVVTHSPQVAARAAAHLLIAKSSDGLVTRTDLRRLDDAGRREEIARMLSGAEVTDEARAQAARLVAA